MTKLARELGQLKQSLKKKKKSEEAFWRIFECAIKEEDEKRALQEDKVG